MPARVLIALLAAAVVAAGCSSAKKPAPVAVPPVSTLAHAAVTGCLPVPATFLSRVHAHGVTHAGAVATGLRQPGGKPVYVVSAVSGQQRLQWAAVGDLSGRSAAPLNAQAKTAWRLAKAPRLPVLPAATLQHAWRCA